VMRPRREALEPGLQVAGLNRLCRTGPRARAVRRRWLLRSPSAPARSAHGRPPWTKPRPTRVPESSLPLSASVVSLRRAPGRAAANEYR
jgi:hypothetical protein